jgi:hypothetical protein
LETVPDFPKACAVAMAG